MSDNKTKRVKRDICDICGTEIRPDTELGCSICEEKYFDKIKGSYNKSLEKINSLSKDLFAFYFDISDEFIKSSYKIISQYLEMEKNLGNFNPSWYYSLTSYQYMRNYFLGQAIENIDVVFSNLRNICMNYLSMASDNAANFIENTNKFYVSYQDAIGIRKKDLLSDSDERLVQTTQNIEKIYDSYQDKNKVKEYNTLQNNRREFDV
ncbi:MAG: hypothetical protein KGI10_08690 [Thaumarchaeota archaeon]|nr:hypothetical protein [Nitrososphaerota archaeon]